MAERKSAKRAGSGKRDGTFTAEERAAMRERARETKRAGEGDGESDLRAKIAEMKGSDREMAAKIHALVRAAAPDLEPRTWYGMPAWAKDGKVLCFFQSAAKFRARYATFGFSDLAKLDAGAIWPTSFALTALSAADEKKIAALVKKAAR